MWKFCCGKTVIFLKSSMEPFCCCRTASRIMKLWRLWLWRILCGVTHYSWHRENSPIYSMFSVYDLLIHFRPRHQGRTLNWIQDLVRKRDFLSPSFNSRFARSWNSEMKTWRREMKKKVTKCTHKKGDKDFGEPLDTKENQFQLFLATALLFSFWLSFVSFVA